MKVLILGQINSQWTLQFVEKFFRKNNYEVWMVKRKNDLKSRKWVAQYKEKGVHFIDCTKLAAEIEMAKKSQGAFLKELYGHFTQIRTIAKAANFDVINMHYVDYTDVKYAVVLKYLTKAKLVFSYWGSDLLRLSKKQLYNRGMLVRQADFVTFDNRDLEFKFKEIYKWAAKVSSETILFGLPVLDIICEKCKHISAEDIREKWNVPKDKWVVAIGYSGGAAHQHIEVLRKLEKLDSETKEKIFILLQMTYGGAPQYIKQVKAAVQKTGCEYCVIQNYLADEEVAELRIMTDIFINSQTTDAFSGSVCENLFSGTILINARWLRYQEFKDYDFQYLEFKNMDEIGNLIKIAMEKKIDVLKNRRLVWQLRSWECCAPKWQRMFQDLSKADNTKRGWRKCVKQQLF